MQTESVVVATLFILGSQKSSVMFTLAKPMGSYFCCAATEVEINKMRSHRHFIACILYDLESMSIRIIFRINRNCIVPVDPCPAFNAGADGGFSVEHGLFFYPANKFRTDKDLVNKLISRSQLSFCIPLRHSCGCACAAGRPVNGFIAVKYCIACRGTGINSGAG